MFSKKGLKRMMAVPLAAAVMFAQGMPEAIARDSRGGGPGGGPGLSVQGRDHHPGPAPQRYYSNHYMPHGRYVEGLPHGFSRLFWRGLEYYYWEGMYYRMIANRYQVVPAPVGVVVTAIPAGCQPVIVNGTQYYVVNDASYVTVPSGYQVVQEPEVIVIKDSEIKASAKAEVAAERAAQQQTAAQTLIQTAATTGAEGEYTINVANSKGIYVPVVIRKSGAGFLGPQGEFYTEFPKVEQLKAMYAK